MTGIEQSLSPLGWIAVFAAYCAFVALVAAPVINWIYERAERHAAANHTRTPDAGEAQGAQQ